MSLAEYRRKRAFKKTPEPSGKKHKADRSLMFVIQKHDATRLHYDVRLEIDGVLKSWAVPKGPSLNPNDKRLAMQMEDHPMEYGSFEGIIPEGNYGAGEVIVWDAGTYESLDRSPTDALTKGHLHVRFLGKKVKGEYDLIRMHGKEERAWLLVKKKDEFVSRENILEKDESVLSGKTLEDMRKEKKVSAKGTVTLPRDMSPMLATLVLEPFNRKGWYFEWKWDGYRAMAELEGKSVHLKSRRNLLFDEKYPKIIQELKKLGHRAVLDGEIVALDGKGRSDFQSLQNWSKGQKAKLAYIVFDLLYLDGFSLIDQPLKHRKELLKDFLGKKSDVIRYGDHRETKGVAMFNQAKKKGFEGIIAKNAESLYRPGKRGSDWLKMKTHHEQEVVIGGFTRPRKSRKRFGAIVVGIYDGDDLKYCGHTGTGFTEKSLDDLYKKMHKLKRKTSPFKLTPKTNEPATWIEPRLVCEVKFQEWTVDGMMRIPVFKGLREDKNPKDVHREEPQGNAVKNPREKLIVSAPRVVITNPDKVLFPNDGYTKSDLAAYYDNVADMILPYLKDRPESLLRHPNGINGENFFQKDVDHMPPDWVRVEPIYSKSKGKEIRYLVCDDRDTLLYLSNLGCIELNPWHSRIGSLNEPDYCILDLDPQGTSFDEVVVTAQHIHRFLEEKKLPSFCKTSGKRGLHIFIPLKKMDYDQSVQLAKEIAKKTHEELPKMTTIERMKSKRGEKYVYIDTLQNRRAQTLAAPYSVRPWPGATVSTPLRWSEVQTGLDPSAFTIKTIIKRINKLGDLWQELRDF